VVQKHVKTRTSRKLWVVQKHEKNACGAEALGGPGTREDACVAEALGAPETRENACGAEALGGPESRENAYAPEALGGPGTREDACVAEALGGSRNTRRRVCRGSSGWSGDIRKTRLSRIVEAARGPETPWQCERAYQGRKMRKTRVFRKLRMNPKHENTCKDTAACERSVLGACWGRTRGESFGKRVCFKSCGWPPPLLTPKHSFCWSAGRSGVLGPQKETPPQN